MCQNKDLVSSDFCVIVVKWKDLWQQLAQQSWWFCNVSSGFLGYKILKTKTHLYHIYSHFCTQWRQDLAPHNRKTSVKTLKATEAWFTISVSWLRTMSIYRSRLWLPGLLCSRFGSSLHSALIQQCPERDKTQVVRPIWRKWRNRRNCFLTALALKI